MDKIKIGYKVFDIKEEEPKQVLYVDGEELYGALIYDDNEIILSKNVSKEQKEETFIHEVLHGIDLMYQIGLEEEQIERLGKGIYITLKDNNLIK